MAELNSLSVDDPVVIETIEELEFGIRAENDGGKATWLECFSMRNQLWKRTINGMMLQFIQQLNGQNFYCMRSLTRWLNLYLTSPAPRLLRRHVLQERRHEVSSNTMCPRPFHLNHLVPASTPTLSKRSLAASPSSARFPRCTLSRPGDVEM